MTTVDVITAIYGGYEPVRPVVPQTVEVRNWILVHDYDDYEGADWEGQAARMGWTPVYEPRPHLHPNVAAKVPKFRPDLYSDADITIWIDGHALIRPTLAEHCMRTLGTGDDGVSWAMYPHPQRSRLESEVAASRGLTKYDDLPLEEQVNYYIYDRGYPNQALWATGIIARCKANPITGDCWLREVVRWGFQDQLSFAYLAWKRGLHIASLGHLWDGIHVSWGGHGQ